MTVDYEKRCAALSMALASADEQIIRLHSQRDALITAIEDLMHTHQHGHNVEWAGAWARASSVLFEVKHGR